MALHKRSGICKRHSVLLQSPEHSPRQSFYEAPLNGERGPGTAQRMQAYQQEAGRLATRSAMDALSRANCSAGAITHLVTASCSGFFAPGIDCELIERLGLNRGVRRVNVGFMGCHAAINALSVARAFCQSDPSATALVCSAELCSLYMQYGWDRERVLANALFADGAATAVLAQSNEDSLWSIQATGSFIVPDTAQHIQWCIGDNGFEMRLSAEVPEILSRYLRPWVQGFLASEGLSLPQIGSWAIHPGGPRIVQSAQEALGIDPQCTEASLDTLAQFGNMSSPTLLFVIQSLIEKNAELPCVAMAFGPGLAIEAAILS